MTMAKAHILAEEVKPDSLDPAQTAVNGEPVNIGEHEMAFLLGRELRESGDPVDIPSPKVDPLNDVHDIHHIHPITDEDILSGTTDPGAEEMLKALALINDAIARCKEDPGALKTEEFNEAARLIRERDNPEWARLRVAIKREKPNGLLLGEIDKDTRPPSEIGEERSIADDLVALVQERAELFHGEDGACFAALKESPRKVFKLDTKAFDEWLGYAYYRDTESEENPGRAASDSAIRTARTVLSGIAKNDGAERKTYLRAAQYSNVYYIDLGDEDWRVIEVRPDGWRVVDHSPVYFWRASTVRPLPKPVPGGDLSLLWVYANIPKPARLLVLACLLEWFRPETPFPILEIVGQQGSAKSSTQAKLRRCVDPNAVDLRAAPKSVEDLFVSAGCNWVVSLNNLSHLSANLQDALCNLATGGGFAGRTLYTNADETLIEAKRPVIVNGIVPLITAQDLTDRVIHVELPEISTYRSETEINADFERDASLIVGGLLDLLVRTLRELPNVRLPRPPRMADFTVLGEAMCLAQGYALGHFQTLYEENRRSSIARNLEASPVAMAIRTLGDLNPQGSLPIFEGTMKQLLIKLEGHRDGADAWPKSARGLGDALRRQRPALHQVGISVEISKPGKQGVMVIIRHKGERGERGERHSEVSVPETRDSLDAEVF